MHFNFRSNTLPTLFRVFTFFVLLATLWIQKPLQNVQAQSGTPQLILTKSIEGGVTTAQVGDTIRYRIRFECSSLVGPCGRMEITDVLQAGLDFNAADTSIPVGFSIGYDAPTRTITITKDDNNLLDGSQYDAVISVKVRYDLRPLPATINNTVGGRIDPPGPTSWLTATPASAPPVSIGKVSPSWKLTKNLVSPSVNPTLNTDVTYQISLCPQTPASGGIAPLQSATITDTLPAGAIFTSASDGGIYAAGVVTWPVVAGPIEPPACVIRFVTIRYPGSTFAIGNNVTNTASADGTYTDNNNTIVGPGIGIPDQPIIHPIAPIVEVPYYSKDSSGDIVGNTGTGRFMLNLNTLGTNYPSSDLVLYDNLPPQLQVTSVTSGEWSSAYQNVRAYVEYSTDYGITYTAFPGQPVSYNTNATFTTLPANITNVRWRFEYDPGTGVYVAGLPYTWSFSTSPEIRVTPRATSTTADPPSGVSMPAAIPNTTYTNCLQVGRTDSTGKAVLDACSNKDMTVEGSMVSLRTSKNATPGAAWDDLDDPTINSFTADSNILPGDTLRFTINVSLTERSSAPLIDPTILDTLPNDLIFVRNGTASLDGTALTTQPTFAQSGPNPGAGNSLKWKFPGLTITPFPLGSHTLTVEFYARVPRGQTSGTRTNSITTVTNSADVVCEIGTQGTDGSDIDGDFNTTEKVCSNTDPYSVERSAALRGEKWIRAISVNPVNSQVVDGTTFLPGSCPNGGTVGLTDIPTNPFTRYPCIAQAYPEGAINPGLFVASSSDPTLDQFEYNLRIFNDGNVDMLNYVLYDILPYVGDTGSGGTLTGTARLSEFRPLLSGPVQFISGPTGMTGADFTIEYNATSNPCRPEVFDQPVGTQIPAGCDDTWTTSWSSSAKSYRIRLNGSSAIPPSATLGEVRFGVPMYIPADSPPSGIDPNDAQSHEIAWNSFSHVGSYDKNIIAPVAIQDLLASEPRKVGITVPVVMSVGNRVWRDSDNSGTINAPDDTTPGIANVQVNLYRDADNNGKPDGLSLATTTTDSGGYYLFSNIPYDATDINNNRYIIGIPGSNFAAGKPLEKLRSSTGAPVTSTYTNPPATNPDSSDHGIDTLIPGQEVLSASFVLQPNTEPTGEADLSSNSRDGLAGERRGLNGETDNSSNLTIDFGFFGGIDVPFSIGNRVWYDNGAGGGTINDGIQNGTEPPVAGVRVNLYRDGNGNGKPDANELIRYDTTDSGGYYLFDNLDPGHYFVEIPASEFGSGKPLQGWYSSQPVMPINVDRYDNGINSNTPDTTGILSSDVVLTRGVDTPTGESDLSGDTSSAAGFNPTAGDGPLSRGRFGEADETSNLTVDFGFIPAMSLGNRVWIDDGSGTLSLSGFNNGIQDGTEAGVGGVRVELWQDTNGTPGLQVSGPNPDSLMDHTSTDAQGYYLFEPMQPGNNYYVYIPKSNFASGKPLYNYYSSYDSNQSTPPADDKEDKDDNGIDNINPSTNGITSPEIVMAYGTEPLTPGDEIDINNSGVYGPQNQGNFGQTDANSNLTMDFGFVQVVAIGNRIWSDTGAGVGHANNGIFDSDESGIDNVTVELFRSGDTLPYATTTTSGGGYYQFDNLPVGDYYVHLPASNFNGTGVLVDYVSSFGSGTDDKLDNNIDENGIDAPAATLKTAGISSMVYSLSPGNEPTTDDQSNYTGFLDTSSVNFTDDFGFVQLYAIGDRVWFDTNNNALIDSNEVGVPGVTVELYQDTNHDGSPDGSAIMTATTDANGYYLFDSLFPGDYVVVLPASNFDTVLKGYWSSSTSRDDTTGLVSETTAPLANSDINSDDNGTLQSGGAVTSSVITLGPQGLSEPVSEGGLGPLGQGGQADGRANMTVDFGFYTTSLGNLVFVDTNKNGRYDSGETPLNNVTVELYGANGTSLITTTLTDSSGNYGFTGQPAGTYTVKVITPAGAISTIDTADATDTGSPITNTDFNDNGIGLGSGTVSAAPVSLTPGDSGLKGNNTVLQASGSTNNPTIDFGFTLIYSLGNRVWFDTDNSGTMNGVEVGVPGVSVQLFDVNGIEVPVGPDGILGTSDDGPGGMLTDTNGYYLFNNLPAGDYRVVIPASNFAGVLKDHWSSGTSRDNTGKVSETTAPLANSDQDLDDNGTLQTSGSFTGAVVSSLVTLGPGTNNEPTDEKDLGPAGQGQPDAQANLTVDFGFYTMDLGNLVWSDTDNSGTLNGSETGIDNVKVQLWSGDASTFLQETTTSGGGIYGFSGLPEGQYIVRIPHTQFEGSAPLRNLRSSTGGSTEPASSPDVVLTDSDDNGTETGGILGMGAYTQTSAFNLTPGNEQTLDNSSGLTTENRVDFGFYNAPQIDLGVTKDDGTTYYVAGGTLNYTIVITNNGPADSVGAVVTDSKPAQIASWTWTCAPGTPAAYHCDGASAGANDFSDTIDLPYGETLTYNVSAQVTPTLALPPTTLVNTVTVSTPGYTETNPNNNTATDTDQPASLLITKDDGVSIVIAGDTLTYHIVIQNNGGVKLDSMTVTDTLPADVTFVKAMQGSVSIPPSTKVGNVLTWTSARIPSLGNLGVGASTSFDIVVKVNSAPAASTLTNLVTVTDSHTGSTGTARDTDTIAKTNLKTLTGTSEVDSGSLIPANPEPVLIGEILTYTVQLTVPAGTMQSLKATDVLDQGLAYVRCDSISAGTLTTDLSGGFNAACTNGLPPTNPLVTAQPPTDANSINQGRRMVFDLGNVTNPGPNDQILTLTYKVIVLDIKSNVNGTKNLNNHVVWTWNATSSLSGEATPVSVTEPVLKITKKADPTTAVLGTPINFTLDVAHTSQSTAPAYTVEVKDILPTGLTYVPGSYSATGLAPTTFNYDASTRTLRFDWDVIPLGQNVQITYKAIFIGPSPTINTVGVEWTSIRIDPTNPNLPPNPVQRSVYNINSTERWYNPLNTVPNNYHAVSKVTIQVPQSGLPDTGFAPGQVSNIPAQPSAKAYTSLDGMQIEIPALGLYIPVTGVPYVDGRWDLTWLSNQAGYLEGTTYPGQVGTAGITGHVTLADGTPGPFHDLGKLKWGDQIILHLGGQKYIYELRELLTVSPSDLSVFKNDGYTWLTLITCSDFTPVAQAYINRTAARAVLVRIENDSSAGITIGPDKLP